MEDVQNQNQPVDMPPEQPIVPVPEAPAPEPLPSTPIPANPQPEQVPTSPIPTPPTTSVPPNQPGGSNATLMAVLSYLGILVFVPILMGTKEDPFVKFHVKQGLGLFISWLALGALSFVFSMFIAAARIPLLGLVGIIFPLLYLVLFVLMIVGIMNAVGGKTKELPIVGALGNQFNI